MFYSCEVECFRVVMKLLSEMEVGEDEIDAMSICF